MVQQDSNQQTYKRPPETRSKSNGYLQKIIWQYKVLTRNNLNAGGFLQFRRPIHDY